jgi:hypothetical protein
VGRRRVKTTPRRRRRMTPSAVMTRMKQTRMMIRMTAHRSGGIARMRVGRKGKAHRW